VFQIRAIDRARVAERIGAIAREELVFNGPLYDQMTKVLHLTGKAQRTVYGYLRSLRRLTGEGPYPTDADQTVFHNLLTGLPRSEATRQRA